MKKKRLLIPFSAALITALTVTAVPVMADYVDADGFTWVNDISGEADEPDSYNEGKATYMEPSVINETEQEEVKELEDAVEVEDRFEENKNEDIVINDVNSIILPELTRDGYKHLYWSNTPDDTGTRYMIGSEYEIGTDSDIYAIWTEKNEFVIKLDTAEFEAGGKKLNTPQSININGTETGEFKNSVFVGTIDELDVSAAANAISASYNNADTNEDLKIEVIDVQGGILNKNIVKPTEKTVSVTYKVTALRTDEKTNIKEPAASATFIIKYDIDADAFISKYDIDLEDKEEKASDPKANKDSASKETVKSDAKTEEKKDNKSTQKESVYSFIPIFEGVESSLEPIAIKEMTEVSAIAPQIEGFEYDHAKIGNGRVVMLDKNEYYDDDWKTIDKDTEIILVYRKAK